MNRDDVDDLEARIALDVTRLCEELRRLQAYRQRIEAFEDFYDMAMTLRASLDGGAIDPDVLDLFDTQHESLASRLGLDSYE